MNARKLGLSSAALVILAAICWFFFVRVPLVTAEFLQGEWVQDPEFLQHAGADLDAQKAEVEYFENYELVFTGKQLAGWRNVFDEGKRSMDGWPLGKGTAFQSDFELAKGKNATLLRFSDHAKKPVEATLVRDGEKIAVSIGDRKLRLMKGAAMKLKAGNL